MGREVRRVPSDWEHPRGANGRYRPLHDRGFAAVVAAWDRDAAAWERGEFPDYASAESRQMPFAEWNGPRPTAEDYMPDWPEAERTHYQMYEDTSEGTPISPVMATPEELARWLADNNASAFASMTATYEQWLRVCRGGFAPSMVLTEAGAVSGVAALSEREERTR